MALLKKEQICPYCQSENVLRYGRRSCKKGYVQIYFCKSCERRFTPKDGFRRMRHDRKIIELALDCHAKHMHFRDISEHLKRFYDVDVSHVAILYWVRNYTELIKNYTETLKPDIGSTILADETVLPFNSRKNWVFIAMDLRTRFWIAHKASLWKNENGCRKLFEKVATLLPNSPEVIATDGAFCYSKVVKAVFPNSRHFRYTNPEDKSMMQIMERLNGTIKHHTKTKRGMFCLRTAEIQMDFLQIYYNFVREHQALNGATPADFAGIGDLKGNKWRDLISRAVKVKKPWDVNLS